MRILGIDPGTQVCGYGIIEDERNEPRVVHYGVVRSRERPVAERLLVMHEGLLGVIDEFAPDVAAVETAFFGKNVRSALRMGEGRGVALLAAVSRGLEVVEYSPAEVKRAVVGSGRADKFQVQQMVRVLLRLDRLPEPEDAADALAIAICHFHRLPASGR